MPYCPQCGKEIRVSDKFCPGCGAEITKGKGGIANLAERIVDKTSSKPAIQRSETGRKSFGRRQAIAIAAGALGVAGVGGIAHLILRENGAPSETVAQSGSVELATPSPSGDSLSETSSSHLGGTGSIEQNAEIRTASLLDKVRIENVSFKPDSSLDTLFILEGTVANESDYTIVSAQAISNNTTGTPDFGANLTALTEGKTATPGIRALHLPSDDSPYILIPDESIVLEFCDLAPKEERDFTILYNVTNAFGGSTPADFKKMMVDGFEVSGMASIFAMDQPLSSNTHAILQMYDLGSDEYLNYEYDGLGYCVYCDTRDAYVEISLKDIVINGDKASFGLSGANNLDIPIFSLTTVVALNGDGRYMGEVTVSLVWEAGETWTSGSEKVWEFDELIIHDGEIANLAIRDTRVAPNWAQMDGREEVEQPI